MKDAEAEEEVGEERISVSLLRETSGLSRVRAPTPIVIGEELPRTTLGTGLARTGTLKNNLKSNPLLRH